MNILPIIPQFFPEENGKNLVAVSDFDSVENYKVVYNFDRKRVLENSSTLMYNLLRK